MKTEIEERMDAYLEGTLSPEATVAFERALLDPAVASAFAEELMIRELLAIDPPHRPPQELVESIIQSLELEEESAAGRSRRLGFPRMRAALQGMGWVFKGPGMAVSGPGGRQAFSGLGTIRYVLGPLGRSSRTEREGTQPKRRSFWRRALTRKK